MNSCNPACLNRLGFRLLFEKGIRVSVCGDLLNVFLKEILLFPVARTGLRERIRVQAAVDYSRSLGEQLRRTLPSDRQSGEIKAIL
jgi:hypothetical protein